MNQKKRELQQNELADTLETNLEKIKPHLPMIIGVSTIVILATIAIAFWMYTRRSITESQWREYFVSSRFNDARGMDTVAEIFPDTTVGELALVNAGDADFAIGSNSLITNRDEYENKLKKAADRYKQVVEGASNQSPFAKMRATMALAYTYESLGKFSEAKALYDEIVENSPESPEGKFAAKCLVRINDPEVTAIYTAFNEWTPPAQAPGVEGGTSLPARPDISMPADTPADPAPGDESGVEDGEDKSADDDAMDESDSDSDGTASNDGKADSGNVSDGDEEENKDDEKNESVTEEKKDDDKQE